MIKLKLSVYNSKTFYELTENSNHEEKVHFHTLVKEICTHNYTSFYKTKNMRKAEAVQKKFRLDGMSYFPTGLFPDVYQNILINEEEIEIIDNRIQEEYNGYEYSFPYDLDEDQITCIENGLEYRRGYFHAVTASGKTSIIISLLCELGGNSIVLVPSVDLVRQVSKDIEDATGKFVTRLQGRKSIDGLIHDNAQIVVASTHTIWSNYEQLGEIGFFEYFDNVFGDEIHHVGMKTGKKGHPDEFNSYYIIMFSFNSFNKFGFSGTIEEDIFIKSVTGQLLGEIKEDTLINKGRISKPYVFMLEIQHETIQEYKEAFKKCILENENRNNLVLEIALYLQDRKMSTMIMVDSKQIQLMNLFEKSGFTYVTGDTPGSQREKIYNSFKEKEIYVLMTTVAKEGVNLPNLDCVLRAGAIKSYKRIKQEKGRGLRIDYSTGKDKLLLIDFFDDDKFWRRYDPIEKVWKTKVGYLKNQSKERFKIYKEVKNSVVKIIKTKEELFEVINGIWV